MEKKNLTVRACLKTYFYEKYSVYSNFYAEFRSVEIFEISFTVQKILVNSFTHLLTVRGFFNPKTTFMSSKLW